ncbi:potassium-transporting ATPase subunit F, partial [Klebsiella quasipneumoniae]
LRGYLVYALINAEAF